MNPNRQVISITDKAAEQIATLIQQRGVDKTLGIRINIKKGGCSGLSYAIEYADKKMPFDEIIEDKGVKVLLDPKLVMYVIGSELDYIEDLFKAGFVFVNPNEKSKCGCGKSFSV